MARDKSAVQKGDLRPTSSIGTVHLAQSSRNPPWRISGCESHDDLPLVRISTRYSPRQKERRGEGVSEWAREREGAGLGHSCQSEAGCSAPALGTPLTYGRTGSWCINCNSLSSSCMLRSHAGSHYCAIIPRNSSDAPTGILSAHILYVVMRGSFDRRWQYKWIA